MQEKFKMHEAREIKWNDTKGGAVSSQEGCRNKTKVELGSKGTNRVGFGMGLGHGSA